MKVALVYDRVNKWGGAERVLLALHNIFPDAPLFTSVYDKKKAAWANVFSVKTSWLQYIPFAKSHHEFYPFLMPLSFEQFRFDNYDLVISVTSESAKGILTGSKTKHICICLTPTRYLWSGYEIYFSHPIVRVVTKPIVTYLRQWDIIASKRPDMIIAISREVQKRIKKYYQRDSEVIYPPIMLESRIPQGDYSKSQESRRGKKDDYFLVVSRLSKFTQYKKVDLAIKACSKLKLPLVVVGDGDIDHFRSFAGSSITFTGKVTDDQLIDYYKNCKALIFPGVEDFGLVMAEAQLFGKPVIAYRAGGALEIVQEGITGTFFDTQTVASLVSVLKSFHEKGYNSEACKRNAKRFTFAQFEKGIHKYLQIHL